VRRLGVPDAVGANAGGRHRRRRGVVRGS
jgi:hypothetical protein